MSAKEMFEKLGYAVVYTNNNGDIQYEKQFEYAKVIIYFVNKEKEIEMICDTEITYTIEFDELQAINKQVEELGWEVMSKDIRHFVLETLDFGKFDVVEYKEYQKLENIIKEVREFAKLRKEMYERQENVVGQEVIISLLDILDKGE